MTVNIKKICFVFFAISGILSLYPYFVWNTFANGYLTYLSYASYLITVITLIAYKRNSIHFTFKHFFAFLLLLMIYFNHYIFPLSSELDLRAMIGGGCVYLVIFSFLFLEKDEMKDVLNIFTKFFIISLIPGLLYYLLEKLGISLAINKIYSPNQVASINSLDVKYDISSGYYLHYIGAVMRISSNTRFSGIYDEAGLVGTVSALLIISKGINIKKDKSIVFLLISLILSFSVAGYLLFLIYIVLITFKKGYHKLFFVTLAFFIAFVLVLNINTSNEVIINLQNRFINENGQFDFINNRETSQFDRGFKQFENADILVKLFGFGRGSSVLNPYINGSSSYRCSIYDYGYIGFGLMIVFYLLMIAFSGKLNYVKFILILVFFISVYQRPAIMTPFYLIIFVGGLNNLNFVENKGVDSSELFDNQFSKAW